jgi:hypothetical protein
MIKGSLIIRSPLGGFNECVHFVSTGSNKVLLLNTYLRVAEGFITEQS